MEVTSQDVMEAAQIGNPVTLTRWRKMGLIPPPDVRTHPSGRGKIAYWPEWVLERCLRIQQLKNTGKSLGEIADLLGSDWEAEHREHQRRRYRFADASAQMDRQAALINLQDAVERVLRGWISSQQSRLRRTSVPIFPSDVVEQAVLMAEQGINPVLVIEADWIGVAPDFLISQKLSQSRSLDRPLFVVPLFDILQGFLGKCESIPNEPTMRPSSNVSVFDSDGEHERRFVATDGWSFEIEKKTGRRTKRKRKQDGS